MDLSVPDRQFGLAQPHPAVALMKSASDAEFVAVPRADDVALGFVIGLRPRILVARDRLKHALHESPLGDRSRAFRSSVMCRLTILPEPNEPRVPCTHQ